MPILAIETSCDESSVAILVAPSVSTTASQLISTKVWWSRTGGGSAGTCARHDSIRQTSFGTKQLQPAIRSHCGHRWPRPNYIIVGWCRNCSGVSLRLAKQFSPLIILKVTLPQIFSAREHPISGYCLVVSVDTPNSCICLSQVCTSS